MIIGLAGKAGAGKDTVADILVRERGFVKVALADEIKRICKRVFDFSDQQLWGPSEMRNAPDARYERTALRSKGPNGEVIRQYLTTRHAAQQLGTEWGRACYENVWIDLALRIARAIEAGAEYSQRDGLKPLDLRRSAGGGFSLSHARRQNVVIPDVRFINEADAIRKAGGQIVVIDRPGAGLAGAAGAHVSEQGIAEIMGSPPVTFLANDRTIDELKRRVLETL